MKTIELVISPSGQSRIEMKGFSGRTCLDASRFLEATLGKTTLDSPTAEIHQGQSQQHNHLQQET